MPKRKACIDKCKGKSYIKIKLNEYSLILLTKSITRRKE